MKKLMFGLLIVGSGAWAEFEVKMNVKALYGESFEKLSTSQQNYIYDNMEKIRSITDAALKKETITLRKEKGIEDKNVIELMIEKDGSVKEINFLVRSDNRRFDNMSKKVLDEAIKSFPKPSEATPIRMVMIYENGNIRPIMNKSESRQSSQYNNYIQRGTTRFEHSMNQQVREFETSRDGFINANVNPGWCGALTLLSESNQRIDNGTYSAYTINREVPKGKYKLLVQTKETCNVNIQYP